MRATRIGWLAALALLLAAATPGAVPAERPARGIAAEAPFEFGPTWSVDDALVFFAGTPPSAADARLELVRVAPDGSGRRALTDAPGRDWQPWFSPDGRTLYFSSERGGNPEIHAMDADGGGLRALTDNGAANFTPYPSPDGRRLAYASDAGGSLDLYVLELDSGTSTRLTTDPARDWLPAWRPDGGAIAFVSDRDGNDELYLADLSGGLEDAALVRLTHHDGADTRVNWYDGHVLVWERARAGNLDLYAARLSADGLDALQPVTRLSADDFGRPAFSPRGDRMAFGSTREGSPQVFVADVLPPFSRALDANANGRLDDAEALAAVEAWAREAPLSGVGRPLSDALVARLIDAWAQGLPLETLF